LFPYTKAISVIFGRTLEDLADGRGLSGISAKLFCKHSQIAFMPYGVVLKDERRTSNIERPTSNKKTNIQYRTFNHAKAWFLFSRFDTHNENIN
jgi:hypothetical protein